MAAAFAIHALGPIRRPDGAPSPAPVSPAAATPAQVPPPSPSPRTEAEPGDLVTFHYVVYGPNGREVANSVARGLPFTERLGEAVRGWQASLVGARSGETRTATVPGGVGLPGQAAAGTTVQIRFTVLRVVKRLDVALLTAGSRPITSD
ncbi:MAG: FKBP-type peptidyl-prolyl cis-trans isomerase [Fimbriimonadaceae bacterium]|nr:FKBP-type peptidyl-prolyl cis-trans isomerase [Fimbriimonadaceae bacterium]